MTGLVRAALSAVLGLAACSLPPNTALRDWAWTASALIDRPAIFHDRSAQDASAQAARAQQQVLAIYLYALGVLAEEEKPLTFRNAVFAEILARAGPPGSDAARRVMELGLILAAARDENLPPGARANSAYPAPLVEDRRLRQVIRAGNAPVQALIAAIRSGPELAHGDTDAATYRRLLDAIGQDHAMIAAEARHIEAREVARGILGAEDRLLRIARALPSDAAVLTRGPGGGAVAAVVQP